MSMETGVRVAGYNVCAALSEEARAAYAVEDIKQLDSDIVVLPEAAKNYRICDGVTQELEGEGYTILQYDYNDIYEPYDTRPALSFLLLSRLAVDSQVYETGIRRYAALGVTETDKDPLTMVAVHLDDRSESGRLQMVQDVQDNPDINLSSHSAMVGDYNALHSRDIKARMYRSKVFGGVARVMPHQRIGYAGERLHEMGLGKTMDNLVEQAGLEDADPWHRSTMLLGRTAVLGQMDRIMYSRHDTLARDFTRHIDSRRRAARVSDHIPISATIHLDDSRRTYF